MAYAREDPIRVSAPPSEPPMPPSTSADDEAFVTGLATSLVCLVVKWRERAASLPADWPVPSGDGGTRHAYMTAADELEAVLRSAT